MALPQTPRHEYFHQLFPDAPAYRWQQVEKALLQPGLTDWDAVSVLPTHMRQALVKTPWMSLTERLQLCSANSDTYKAALTTQDGYDIETVLMRNARDQWSICVSSQIGCAMRCAFCATGTMGLTRNLTSDEIEDQYRYWIYFLRDNRELLQRISNIVFMGMGEPLANYDNVKSAITSILTHTDIGKTHITVSTVGILPILNQLIEDEEWPHTRLAISLHSADDVTRKKIVPSSQPQFLTALTTWAKRYQEKWGNRRHYLTFEYIMLAGVNDTDTHAAQLERLANRIGNVRINLIPYNIVDKTTFQKSDATQLDRFANRLINHGVTVTVRRSMGDDIAAACGQLATKK